MELTRTIIVISLFALLINLTGCASSPEIRSRGPGEGITEPEEVDLPDTAPVGEIPDYVGMDEGAIALDTIQDPRRKASIELTNKGKEALFNNNYAMATKNLESAISIDSKNPFAYYYLALLEYRQGRYDVALGHLRFTKINSKDDALSTESYIMAGRISEELRRWSEAQKEYAKAAEIDPNNHVAQEGLSRVERRIASFNSLEQATTEQTPEEVDTGEY